MAKSSKSKTQIGPIDLTSDEVKTRVVGILGKQLEEWAQWRAQNWEPRWTKSWQRIHNVYDKELSESEGVDWRSSVFFGATRQKLRVAKSIVVENVLNQGRLPFDLDNTPVTDSPDAKAFIEELKVDPAARVKKMKQYIDDQFIEAKLSRHLFSEIDSQIGLGTGVIKGPTVTHRTRNQWVPKVPPAIQAQGFAAMQQAGDAVQQVALAIQQQRIPPEQADAAMQQAQQNAVQVEASVKQIFVENVFYELEQRDEAYPDLTYLDLWDIFCDPEDEEIQTSRGVYERMILTKEGLAALADITDEDNNPVYDVEAIHSIIGSMRMGGEREEMVQPVGGTTYLDHRGPHREDYSKQSKKFFAVFVFSGHLSIAAMDPNFNSQGAEGEDSAKKAVDRYKPHEIIAAFCNGKMLTLQKNTFRRGRRPYHKAVFSRIPGSPYGWGLPDEMEHAQQAYNGFMRLFIDNKRLAGSVGFVVDENKIENPDEPIAPGFKLRVKSGVDVRTAFQVITIPDIGGNLLEAMAYCERWGNAASGIPAFLDGDDTKSKAGTAYEASEMKTSALKQLGMPIRYIDDGIIVPLVEMFYDWNMDNLEDARVKGDFTIRATGYASFKDRTVMGIELRNLLALASTNPEVRQVVNVPEIVRELAHIGEVPETRFLRSDKEIADMQAADAKAQQSAIEAQMQKDNNKIDREHKAKMEEIALQNSMAPNELELRAADMQLRDRNKAADRDQNYRQFLIDQETKRKIAAERATAHSQGGEAPVESLAAPLPFTLPPPAPAVSVAPPAPETVPAVSTDELGNPVGVQPVQ